ncbi:MAG TPA: ABC transporter ATP-binding protein, partial [Afipia sp.]
SVRPKVQRTGPWPAGDVDLSDILHPAPAASEAALTFRDVSVRFEGLTALNALNDSVQAGAVHGIIGPNGAGKSTLLNVISGFYKVSEGSITLFGERLDAHSNHAKAGIARTFQNTELFGGMSLIDNVRASFHYRSRANLLDALLRLPRQVREDRESLDRAKRLLAYVGLSDFADSLASNLPFGHQRRLEIARALALGPRVLLLDEPAAGLTHTEIEGLALLIHDLATRGLTVVLVEHHFDLIVAVCDRVSVLDYGQLIASGTPAEVQCHPRVREAYLGTVSAASALAESAA